MASVKRPADGFQDLGQFASAIGRHRHHGRRLTLSDVTPCSERTLFVEVKRHNRLAGLNCSDRQVRGQGALPGAALLRNESDNPHTDVPAHWRRSIWAPKHHRAQMLKVRYARA